MIPAITAIFAPNLRSCTITLVSSRGGFTYEGLAVKWIKDIPKGGMLFQVFVPSEADVGCNWMVAFDMDAVQGYRQSNWSDE